MVTKVRISQNASFHLAMMLKATKYKDGAKEEEEKHWCNYSNWFTVTVRTSPAKLTGENAL